MSGNQEFTKEYVYGELVEARRLFGLRTTDLGAVMKGLIALRMLAPESCLIAVDAHVDELAKRMTFKLMLEATGGTSE